MVFSPDLLSTVSIATSGISALAFVRVWRRGVRAQADTISAQVTVAGPWRPSAEGQAARFEASERRMAGGSPTACTPLIPQTATIVADGQDLVAAIAAVDEVGTDTVRRASPTAGATWGPVLAETSR